MPLIRLLFQICIFRKGPQDVPASLPLLWVTLVLYLVMGILLLGQETGWLDGVLRTLAEAVLLGSFLWITLRLMGKSPRLLQTAIAVYASDALVSSMALPLFLLMSGMPEAKPVYLVLLGLMIWHWAVLGHILRHAVSVRWVHGVGLAMAYMVLSYRIMSILFPVEAGG